MDNDLPEPVVTSVVVARAVVDVGAAVVVVTAAVVD